MDKKQLFPFLLCFFVFLSFTPLFSQWARSYGDTMADEYPYSILQTSDGGYIAAGQTSSYGAGARDIWVVKLDWDGAVEWQYTYGGADHDFPYSIQQTSDGGYIVAGYTYSFGAGQTDSWVLKLFSDGTVDWQGTCGGTGNDEAFCIQQTSDGGYIAVGSTNSFGAGNSDVWVVKLDSDGSIVWQNTSGGANYESAFCIQQTDDGGYIVAGYTDSFGAGLQDVWIIKLASNGTITWQKTYGGPNNDLARSIRQTSDGGYIVAAYTDSFGTGRDFWILKLSSSGTVEWQKTYGGTGYEMIHFSPIQETSDGGFIVCGLTNSFGLGNNDFWALKLDSTGLIEWQNAYGGTGADYGCAIQQTSDGGYIFSGDNNSYTAGGYDWLILKLYPNGEIDPACGMTETTTAIVGDTFVTAANTSVTPGTVPGVLPDPTFVTAQATSIVPATVCEAAKYDLTISASTGGTTDPAPGTYAHYSATQAQIRAIPNSGYRFSSWGGDASGTTNPITITMDEDKSVTANFTAIPSGDDDDGGGGGGGLCFIATASFGSPLHPHVETLRVFRDKYLMPSRLGRKFVDLYCKYSPYAAEIIAKHRLLRVGVRHYLVPLVALSYSMVYLGPAISAFVLVSIFILPAFLITIFRRKSKRKRA